MFGFYILKFQNLNFTHWNLGCLNFTPYILEVFYSLKFGDVRILHLKVSKFRDVKTKYSQTFRDKIQILKCQGVKSKHFECQEVNFKF